MGVIQAPLDTETGKSDHRWSLTQSRYCLGRVCDGRRESLGRTLERSTQGSRSWVEGRERGLTLRPMTDRERKPVVGFSQCQQVTEPAALQSQPAGLRRRHSGEHKYTPDLRRPQQLELRWCWGAGCEVGRKEPEKALEES